MHEISDALQGFARRISGKTGEAFFQSFVCGLAEALVADCVFVAELSGRARRRLKTIAVSAHGSPAENFECELAGLPRDGVTNGKARSYTSDLRMLFPQAPLLAQSRADTYVGAPLLDRSGEIRGLAVLLGFELTTDAKLAEALLDVLAGCASAELERNRNESRLKTEQRALEMLAGGAPLNEILDVLTRHLEEQINDVLCAILLLEPGGLTLGSAPTLPESIRGSIQKLAGSAAVPENPGTCSLLSGPDVRDGLRVCWSSPVLARNGVELGRLVLYAPSEHNPGNQEIELIERAVHLAGIAIEQRRAEKELKDSERMLRLLAGNAEEVILAYDMNRRLIYVNPAIEKQTGYSMDEMRSRHFIKWVHRDDDAHMMELWEKLYQGEGYSGIEFRIVTKDGQIRWIHGSWGPLRDENGKQIGVQGREIDITDRKLAEERLRDNEMLLARAQSLAHLGSWQKDLITGELLWSDEIYRIFGLPLGAKLTSTTFYDLLHPADVAAVRTASDEAIRNGTNYAIDHRIIRPDGSERYVHEQAEILRERGIPVRMIGTIQDITDRRQLEERLRQSQKMEAIGQLAGGVAHDFNNLLTGILGHCDLLLGRRRDDDPLRQEIEEIKRAGDRAASLTRQLLAFSRKQVLQPRVLDVRQLVANMSKMLRRLISEDIQLVTVSCPEVWHVRADPGQLEQVILNLVLNARDAMPLGGTLTIGIANLELSQSAGEELGFSPGQYVELAVSDTGQGMDTATLSRIFEPFFTTKQHGKGTGLGLSTVYGIVKQSGGHVRVSSNPGEGTTLRVYLPRVEENTDEAATEEEPADVVVATGTVLLVEDEDVVRRLVRDILEHHGFRVLEARHAEEAMHMAAASGRTIALLLTDVILPQMSGRELADRLLATWPDLKVLYMSGYTDDAILEHGLVDRGRLFLQKPFTPDLLMRKIRDVLQDA